MFDLDLEELQTRIYNYQSLYGKSPNCILLSQHTLDFLNEKIKYELDLIRDDIITMFFGIDIEIDNRIGFCKAEVK